MGTPAPLILPRRITHIARCIKGLRLCNVAALTLLLWSSSKSCLSPGVPVHPSFPGVRLQVAPGGDCQGDSWECMSPANCVGTEIPSQTGMKCMVGAATLQVLLAPMLLPMSAVFEVACGRLLGLVTYNVTTIASPTHQ